MSVEGTLRVMLADSQPISLDGTCSLIQTADGLTLVGTATTMAEAVKKAAEDKSRRDRSQYIVAGHGWVFRGSET